MVQIIEAGKRYVVLEIKSGHLVDQHLRRSAGVQRIPLNRGGLKQNGWQLIGAGFGG